MRELTYSCDRACCAGRRLARRSSHQHCRLGSWREPRRQGGQRRPPWWAERRAQAGARDENEASSKGWRRRRHLDLGSRRHRQVPGLRQGMKEGNHDTRQGKAMKENRREERESVSQESAARHDRSDLSRRRFEEEDPRTWHVRERWGMGI